MRHIHKVVGWLLLPAILGLAACSGREDEVDPQVAELLQMVPADTPYVLVSARKHRFPRSRVEKMLAAQEMDVEVRKQGMDQAVAAWVNMGMLEEDTGESLRKLVHALIEETEGKYSVEGWHSLGMEPRPRGLVYGLGAFPVLWQEVSDETKVENLIARVEARSGVHAEQGRWKDVTYRRVGLASLSLIVAVHRGYLIMALLPEKDETALLPGVLGERLPEKSLSPETFAAFAAERGFSGHAEGYVDVKRLLDAILAAGRQGSLPGVVPESCSGFADELARALPLLSMGMTGVGEKRWTFAMNMETSPGVAAALKKIPAPVPGLGQESTAMLDIGMGVDFPALRDGINSMLRFFMRSGKDCELVDEQALTQAIQSVSMIMNPMLAGIHGFHLELDELKLNTEPPVLETLQGGLVVAAEQPAGLLGMLSSLAPELVRTPIPEDGTPVRLDLGDRVPVPGPVYAAIRGKALAVGLGEQARKKVERLLALSPGMPPPMFAMSFDTRKVVPLMLFSVEQSLRLQEQALQSLEELAALGDEDGELEEQIKVLKQNLENARREKRNAELSLKQMTLYRRSGVAIHAGDHGLEFHFTYDLD
ncbi:hypothetical protein [Thiolapillus sp.]